MKYSIFFGDSITDANHLFSDYPLGEGYLRELSRLARASEIPLFLCNRGYNGHTLQRLISVFHRTWNHGRCQDGFWDLVCIQIGINDLAVCMDTGLSEACQIRYLETYQNNFSFLLSQIRADFLGPILILEPFLFPYPAEFQNWMAMRKQFSSLMEEIGKAFSCTFLPLQSLLVDASPASRFLLFTTDGIHLTSSGNQLLASLIWDQLKMISFF